MAIAHDGSYDGSNVGARSEWPITIATALVATAVFAPALAAGFVHDDHRQIAGNPLVQGLDQLHVLWTTGVWAGAGSGSSWYRPLMMSSFALDRALFGPGALAMHAVSLAAFAALVATVLRAMRRFGVPLGAAVGAALLGALHPLQVEAATWISARCELLVALFGVAAICLHDRSLAPGARSTRALRVATGLAFFLALAAKESAVALAPLFVCVDRLRGAPLRAGALAARHAPWIAATLVYLLLRSAALGGPSGGVLAPVGALDVAGAFGQGALRIGWPASLTIAPPPPAPLHAALGALVAAAGAAGMVHAWRTRSPRLVPLALGLGMLAVAALGAARLGEVADRYLALPAFAAAWLVVPALLHAPRIPRWAGRAALAGAGAAFAWASFHHTMVYANDAVLWSDAWRKNPRSVRAALNLAAVHLDGGEPRRALEWLARAAELAPGDAQIELNRAVAEEQLGDAAGARRRLDALFETNPAYWPAALRAGHLALAAGDARAAAQRYEATVRVHPLAAEAWAGLGVARERLGERDAARAAIDRALALDPAVQNADALRALRARLGP
ncbi:MAG: hypothetical protein DCC71_06295 [Proteobacteria bacterium]|nr:MAG: hypothetical protein DCC71_06295 [Pseudomonadota bacterium]